MSHIRDLIEDGIADVPEKNSIVKPYVMSHGTLECRNLARSRRFYQDFLGLECVVHSPSSMAVRCGLKFHIVAVEVGDDVHDVSILTHWGIDVQSRIEVDEAHAKAVELKEEWQLRVVQDVTDSHGVYGFYIQDFDYNWWEIQYYPGFINEDIFDFGDRYELKELAQ